MKITRFFTFKRCGYESVFLFVIAQSWNNVIMYKPIFNQSQIQCGKGKYASGELRNSFVSEVDTGGIVPEYIQPESGNQKDDIYAFGVLLLELLTGKKSSYRFESHYWIQRYYGSNVKVNSLASQHVHNLGMIIKGSTHELDLDEKASIRTWVDCNKN
ncbi:SWIM zinc finger family protein [Tanacetum coccineum]